MWLEKGEGGWEVGVKRVDRQTDRHVFIWGLIQRKYIDYNLCGIPRATGGGGGGGFSIIEFPKVRGV